ncbi:MAG TPA: hypothetical protein VFE77_17790, partial [Rhodanobacter sp.]|nr:hypothetical protein [Rhodanobacter sp.]
PVNNAPALIAPAAASARASIDPATFSPAEWIRAAGGAPWIPLSSGNGNAAYYAFTAHDHAMLSIKTISARTGMLFETGRVDCHPVSTTIISPTPPAPSSMRPQERA